MRLIFVVSWYLFTCSMAFLINGCNGSDQSESDSTVASIQATQRANPESRPLPLGRPSFFHIGSDKFLQIVAHGSNHSEYVGCFNCPFNSAESVFNPDGFFYSRLVPLDSRFGGVFSDESMCNFAATNPPHLELWNRPYSLGNLRVSVNQFHSGSICNRFSSSFWEKGCQSLKTLCGQ